ncbi:Zinc finger MYM-type protein 1-like [Oopsacas minuta]|uniref:Zinc finger MYM-type protein 1-like n=1 Tax=Oopsacas minuta TaxID=111878 RepID=A0AAV7KF88_9METZ|nr:Zinc finger MYM-type protein 1-like [Oopsacas minuta]
MKVIQPFNPKSGNFLEAAEINEFVQAYNIDSYHLNLESKLAKRAMIAFKLESINSLLMKPLPLETAFPNLVKAIRIAMTIGVSSAHSERSFSILNRVKNYLRTARGRQRLTDLCTLSIESTISYNLDLDEVVQKFCSSNINRWIT